ncbi:MAG: SusC/RagA family TonB-linked outer membrane protein [Alistipes sp.]
MNKKGIQQIKSWFTLFFFVCFLCYNTPGYAQNSSVTIKMSNVTMERVMNEIERQTTYLFLSNKDVNINSLVSVNVTARPMTEAMNQLVKGLDVNYKIDGKYIVLSKIDRQPIPVKGVVVSSNGQPIIGASVVVKGTTVGVSTDVDGKFAFTIPAAESPVLVVTYLGYTTQEIAVGTQTYFKITLADSAVEMENVVVTALGIKRQEKALSYSVQQVKAEELTTVKDANFMNSLVGKVAGVQINSGANGPGGGVRVVMRGAKSIEKDNTVLYVIDGIPMYNHNFGGKGGAYDVQTGSESISDINPEDIESLNMLTGPSAAALYGSDAANGVVIINTKHGSKDHTTVTISNTTTFSKVYQMPQLQTSYGTSSGLMNWGEQMTSNFDAKKFFNTGSNVINSVSVSTGNQKNQTYISASTTNAQGIIPENTYDRYNFTARNTTSFAKDKLVLDFGASFIIQHDANMVSQGKYYNPLPSLYLFPRSDDFDEIRLFERWDPVRGYNVQYWPYGSGAHSLQNPYWIQKRMQRESDKHRYMLNASLKWNITDWMNITGRAKVDNAEYRITQKKYASTLTTFCGDNGGYEDQTQHERSFYGDVMLNINKTFCDDWTLMANIGASLQDQRYEQDGGAGNLIIVNHFAKNNLNYKEKFKPIQNGWHDQTQSIYASVEMGWRSMVYLTLTGRNDWASQLAYSANTSFFYPSVGVSAVVSNMVTMPKWLTFLKVRGSYSKVASAFARYLSHPAYHFDEQTQNWSKPDTYPAYNLKPEDTKSWELGINARLFKHISIDATYYRSNTYHQTIYEPLPESSGYKQSVVQAGDVQNQGLELSLGYDNKWNHFMWSSSYTLTLNRNKIMHLAEGQVNIATGEVISDKEIQKDWLGASNVAPQVILRKGGSMTDIYINHELKRDLNGYIDINPSTGNLSIAETEFRKVGELAPRYTMGWANNFSYKGIDLGVVLAARIGGLAYSATQGSLDFYGASQATADARDAGGVPINKGMANAQKYYSAISTAEGGYGAYYLYSATNVRLQELSLQYTLPAQWFRNKAKLTVGFVAKNLWMIYCKAPFDPEVSSATGSNYYQGVDYFMQPSTRNIGFNVKLQF